MIIAGAGIIGLSCAWKLALCKIPVTVFDAGDAGGEASWAGAGMLAPGGEMEERSTLTEMALRSLQKYPAFVEALKEESGNDIDFRRCGAIEVALNDAEAAQLERRAQHQAAIGMPSEVATYPGTTHARFYPEDAIVDPRQVVTALRQACVQRGVTIREREPVKEILSTGARVRTSLGEYTDDGVVIAAGAWSSSLTSPCRLPGAVPVRGHLISYQVQPGTLATIVRHQNTYLLQRTSGTLVAGSSTEYVAFDRTIDEQTVADIRARASRLMPQLAMLEPSERWVGFRPGIESESPAIGRVEGTRIWTAYGHYRNGILLAPDTADLIVESIVSAR